MMNKEVEKLIELMLNDLDEVAQGFNWSDYGLPLFNEHSSTVDTKSEYPYGTLKKIVYKYVKKINKVSLIPLLSGEEK